MLGTMSASLSGQRCIVNATAAVPTLATNAGAVGNAASAGDDCKSATQPRIRMLPAGKS